MFKKLNLGANTFITGPFVGDGLTVTAYVFLIVSVFSLIAGAWIPALLLLGIGGLMVSTLNIIVLNAEEDYVFSGVLLLGLIKIGSKEKLSKYPYMAILRQAYSGKNRYAYGDGGQVRSYIYDLYLLSETHLSRLHIKTFDFYDDAQETMEKLSASTGIEMVKYSPKRRR